MRSAKQQHNRSAKIPPGISRSRDVCRAKAFCFASLHFLCRRSVDVPVDVQTHLLFGPHTGCSTAPSVESRSDPRGANAGSPPKSPAKGGAQALTLTIFTSAGKARHVACHHSRDKQEKPLDAPLKPDFYEAVNRSAVRSVCCLAVRASARTDSAVRTALRRSARRLIRERGGWV